MKMAPVTALLAACILALATHAAAAADISDALHAYYTAEKSGLPATAAAGTFAAVFGGVLLRRKSDFARGFGLPFLLIGAATSVGSLAYLSRIDARHAYYADLLQQSPAVYQQIEGAHLETMQADFKRIIWIDGSVAAAGLGLAVYGMARNKRFAKGLGIGTLVSAAALTALEMHNRDRSSTYLDVLHTYTAHATLQVGADLRSLSLDFQANF